MARIRLLNVTDVAAEQRPYAERLEMAGGWINLYRAMAHSPAAFTAFHGFLSSLWGGATSARIREIVILSVVSASNARYPFGWHVLDAEAAGLTEAEIRAVIEGDYAALDPSDAKIARLARGLSASGGPSDITFRSGTEGMSEQQIVELVMIAGVYRMVACLANGLRVELDDQPARRLESLALTGSES